MQKKGNKYGTHRVIEPKGLLTQAAKKIDNNMDEIYSNEILCDVSALNIDSASFTQIYEACEKDLGKTEQMILDIVNERGKMQNPVTGSGGMFIGTVKAIGEDLEGKIDLKVGDKIASLVSLSLTPLKINKIKAIHPEIDRVEVDAQAILFESGLYAKLPDDMSEELALAALDVAGAPAQTAKLVKPGDSVLILGGAGKGGMMCCYEAMKRVGPTGNVVALVICQEDADLLKSMNLCHHAIVGSATNPVEVLEKDYTPLYTLENSETIDTMFDILSTTVNQGREAGERRFADVWYAAYGNDDVRYSEAEGHCVFAADETPSEPVAETDDEGNIVVSNSRPPSESVYDKAQALWTAGERILRLTTAQGFSLELDFFPSIQAIFCNDGCFLLTVSQSETLAAILENS